MSIQARIVSLVFLTLALIMHTDSALADQSSASNAVAMRVSAGYGGNFRSDAWLPVRALLSNAGSQVTATITISDDRQQSSNVAPYNRAEYVRSVFLPAGSTKAVVEYIPGADVGLAVNVSLSTSSGQLSRQTVPVSQVPPGTLLVGVLSGTRATYAQFKAFGGALDGIRTIATPLDISAVDPQPGALANLDCIVIANFDSSVLAPDQVSALQAWVRVGGALVLIGGPSATATLAALPAGILPIKLQDPRIVSNLPGLRALAKIPVTAPLIAASGTPVHSAVLLDSGHYYLSGDANVHSQIPLVVQAELGLGSVSYSAIDPSLPPMAQWQGLEHYWRVLTDRVRPGGATLTFGLAGVQPTSSVSTLAGEITGVTPPTVTGFLLLLGLYACVLVPANFIILYRIRRRDLSWLTLPVLSLLLIAAVFVAARIGRGTDPRLSVVSVLYVTSGSHAAQVQRYIGLVTPSSGDYTVSSGTSASLGAPLFFNTNNGTPADAGNPSGLARFDDLAGVTGLPAMTSWSARTMTLTSSTSATALRGNLWITPSGTITGNISNESSAPIVDIVLQAYGAQIVPIGNLAPGASLKVTVPTGISGSDQNSISDTYGSLAWRNSNTVPTASESSGADGVPILASIDVPAPVLELLANSRVDDSPRIAPNPGESLGERFQRISQLVLGTESPARFNAVTAVGWTQTEGTALTVNGAEAPRKDTTMIVELLPLSLHDGPFAINQSSVPARFAGSTQDLQTSVGSAGITLSPNSSADFVAMLPAPSGGKTMTVQSLTLTASTAGAGGALNSESASIWNWGTSVWKPVDLTSGQLTIQDPRDFIDRTGTVRIRISAQSASLALGDPNTALTLGATGEVR